MALVAAVQVRRGCKLSLMLIFVAVHALGECNFVTCVFALWNMALRTGYSSMLLPQGIGAGRVRFHVERRWFETVNGVARGALNARRPFGELSIVNVLVAVGALLEGQRLLEVPIGVALRTFDGLVLAQKRILRF